MTSNMDAFKAVVVRHTAAFKAKKFLQRAFAGCAKNEHRLVAGVDIEQWEDGLTTAQLTLAWKIIQEADEQNQHGRLPCPLVPPKYFAEWPMDMFAN